MTVKMSSLLLPLLFVSTDALFTFPDNVNFVTKVYNTSNCDPNMVVKNNTLPYMCYHSSSNCCREILNEVSIVPNTTLNTCIPTLGGSVMYQCETAHFNHFTTEETFGYIGLVLLIINFIMLLCCCGRCLSKRRNGYSEV